MRTGVTRAGLCAPGLLLAFVLVPGGAMGGEGRPARTASPDAKKKEPKAAITAEKAPTVVQPGESGLVVIRDAETGELRAPEGNEAAELLKQVVPANNQSDEGLVQVPLPGGGYTMNLQGRFQNYFVVTRAADGTLKASCVDQPSEAGLVAAPVTPAPQGEDR